jgi:EthD domain
LQHELERLSRAAWGCDVFKRISLITRKAALSPEQFRTHWKGAHAQIIKSIIPFFPDAGRVRYLQNRTDAVLWQYGASGEYFDIDGFVELHLPARKPVEEAYSSGAAGRMLADEPNFLRAFTECFVDPEGEDAEASHASKIMLTIAKSSETGQSELAMAIRRVFAQKTTGLPGVRQACLNWVTSTVVREKVAAHPGPPNAIVELWVDSTDIARELGEVCQRLVPVAAKISAFKVDPLRIA